MKCQICGKPKDSVSPKKSAIVNGTTLLACAACKEAKFEPRHLIIIVARSKGSQAVREYINKHLYVGAEITAPEITP